MAYEYHKIDDNTVYSRKFTVTKDGLILKRDALNARILKLIHERDIIDEGLALLNYVKPKDDAIIAKLNQ